MSDQAVSDKHKQSPALQPGSIHKRSHNDDSNSNNNENNNHELPMNALQMDDIHGAHNMHGSPRPKRKQPRTSSMHSTHVASPHQLQSPPSIEHGRNQQFDDKNHVRSDLLSTPERCNDADARPKKKPIMRIFKSQLSSHHDDETNASEEEHARHQRLDNQKAAESNNDEHEQKLNTQEDPLVERELCGAFNKIDKTMGDRDMHDTVLSLNSMMMHDTDGGTEDLNLDARSISPQHEHRHPHQMLHEAHQHPRPPQQQHQQHHQLHQQQQPQQPPVHKQHHQSPLPSSMGGAAYVHNHKPTRRTSARQSGIPDFTVSPAISNDDVYRQKMQSYQQAPQPTQRHNDSYVSSVQSTKSAVHVNGRMMSEQSFKLWQTCMTAVEQSRMKVTNEADAQFLDNLKNTICSNVRVMQNENAHNGRVEEKLSVEQEYSEHPMHEISPQSPYIYDEQDTSHQRHAQAHPASTHVSNTNNNTHHRPHQSARSLQPRKQQPSPSPPPPPQKQHQRQKHSHAHPHQQKKKRKQSHPNPQSQQLPPQQQSLDYGQANSCSFNNQTITNINIHHRAHLHNVAYRARKKDALRRNNGESRPNAALQQKNNGSEDIRRNLSFNAPSRAESDDDEHESVDAESEFNRLSTPYVVQQQKQELMLSNQEISQLHHELQCVYETLEAVNRNRKQLMDKNETLRQMYHSQFKTQRFYKQYKEQADLYRAEQQENVDRPLEIQVSPVKSPRKMRRKHGKY